MKKTLSLYGIHRPTGRPGVREPKGSGLLGRRTAHRSPKNGQATKVRGNLAPSPAARTPSPGQKPSKARSPHWPAVERAHLEAEPECQVCGSRTNLQVHHKRPYHIFPALELSPKNLVTLCESPWHPCHLIWGHLGNWKSINRTVEADVRYWSQKIRTRPVLKGPSSSNRDS